MVRYIGRWKRGVQTTLNSALIIFQEMDFYDTNRLMKTHSFQYSNSSPSTRINIKGPKFYTF